MTDRIPAHALDPTGGTPGQVLTINAAGTAVEYGTPSTGGTGGGGGAILLRSVLASQYTSSGSYGSWVTIPSLTLSFTPSVAGVLRMGGRIRGTLSAVGSIAYRWNVSPAPVVGNADHPNSLDSVSVGDKRVFLLVGQVQLAAATTYTITIDKVHYSGTLTIPADAYTEITADFVPS